MFNPAFVRPATAILAFGICTLYACTHPNGDPAPAPGGQPNTVTGVALDPKGQPLAGVRVRAENDVTHSWAEVRTDATGHHTFPKLQFGGWKLYAWLETAYKGQPYTLCLGMPNAADYDAFAPGSQGAVKNFQWQLAGRIIDRTPSGQLASGYFGGTLRFVNFDANFNALPAGTEITVTLMPVAGATLFDGSAPQAVQKSFTVVNSSSAQYTYWVQDIPQCEYRLTAASRYNGTTRPLDLSPDMTTYQPSITGVYFKTSGGKSYESGLGEAQVPAIYIRQRRLGGAARYVQATQQLAHMPCNARRLLRLRYRVADT